MKIVMTHNSLFDIVSRLRTGQPRDRGLVFGRSNTYLHWKLSSLLPERNGGAFCRSNMGNALRYHLFHPVPRLRMLEAIPLTPRYILIVWCLIKLKDLRFC
jgi:hypothetical protein